MADGGLPAQPPSVLADLAVAQIAVPDLLILERRNTLTTCKGYTIAGRSQS